MPFHSDIQPHLNNVGLFAAIAAFVVAAGRKLFRRTSASVPS